MPETREQIVARVRETLERFALWPEDSVIIGPTATHPADTPPVLLRDLRALLAAPQGEPVAWGRKLNDWPIGREFLEHTKEDAEREIARMSWPQTESVAVPLYAAAPVGDARDTERPTHNPRED
jgi:hypothetical protein